MLVPFTSFLLQRVDKILLLFLEHRAFTSLLMHHIVEVRISCNLLLFLPAKVDLLNRIGFVQKKTHTHTDVPVSPENLFLVTPNATIS